MKGVSDVSAHNGFGPWAEPSNGATGEPFSLAWAEPSVYATGASGRRGPKRLTNSSLFSTVYYCFRTNITYLLRSLVSTVCGF